MTPYRVRCEAATVSTDTGICPGMARTEQGEVYIFDGRTPPARGICCQAFTAMNAFRTALMVTDELASEKDGHFDITCPHGAVTFRLTRMS